MAVRFGLNNKNAKGRQEALAKAQKKLLRPRWPLHWLSHAAEHFNQPSN